MKKLWLGFVILLSTLTFAQQKPTVEQCRVHLSDWVNDDLAPLSLDAVTAREQMILPCISVDSINRFEYSTIVAHLDNAIETRYLHFLQRHNLLMQFVGEDHDGRR
jgi:hypothetical protein